MKCRKKINQSIMLKGIRCASKNLLSCTRLHEIFRIDRFKKYYKVHVVFMKLFCNVSEKFIHGDLYGTYIGTD